MDFGSLQLDSILSVSYPYAPGNDITSDNEEKSNVMSNDESTKKRKINAIDDNSDSENDNIPSNKKRKLSQNTNSTNINVFELMQYNSINKHK
eukprot:448565_1